MSVGRKIRWLTGLSISVFSAVCASQVSFADFYTYHDTTNGNNIFYKFCTDTGTLTIMGDGVLYDVWKTNMGYLDTKVVQRNNILANDCKLENFEEIYGSKSCSFIAIDQFQKLVKQVVITDGSNITKIGEKAFHKCSELKEFTIPETVKSIDKNAFSESGLTSIIIPGSVKKIGDSAFEGCTHLMEAKLEYGVQELGRRVFKRCISLESLTIPTSVEVLGDFILNNLYYGIYPLGIKKIMIVNKDGMLYIVNNIKIIGGIYGSLRNDNLYQIPIAFNVHVNSEKHNVYGYKFSEDEASCRRMPLYKWDLNGISEIVTWLCAMNESWSKAKEKCLDQTIFIVKHIKAKHIKTISNSINTPAPPPQTHDEQKYRQPESSSETPIFDSLKNKVWNIFNKK